MLRVVYMAETNEPLISNECEDDVTCPVCYEPLTEPVVFPCSHEVCQCCFHQNLSAANFYCPICRQRISSWARRRVGNPVDAKRKRELEKQRKDACDLPRLTPVREHHRSIAKTGEVREEYLQELRMVEEERRAEEELGRVEALHLAGLSDIVQIEKDCQYAAELAEKIEEEELLRREQEDSDRKLAESLHESYSKPPTQTPSKTMKAKSVSSTKKKKKTTNNQLPITVWCEPKNK